MDSDCDNAYRYESSMLAIWLKNALKSANISQAELARILTARLGKSIDRMAVNKMTTGRRNIAADEMLIISEVTKSPTPNASDGVSHTTQEVVGLPLVGAVQAGNWEELKYRNEDGDFEMRPIARDPRFPRARQYVLDVIGDSMNKVFPEGMQVTCVDFAESGLPIRQGLFVHVERYRNGGQEVEQTLKYLELQNGQLVLAPQSNNPKHKPIPIEGDGDTEIIVRGIVTGSWKKIDF